MFWEESAPCRAGVHQGRWSLCGYSRASLSPQRKGCWKLAPRTAIRTSSSGRNLHTRHTYSHETHINGSRSQEYFPKDVEALPLSWLSLESGSGPDGPGCSQQPKFPSTRPKERPEVQVTGLGPPSLSQLTSRVSLVPFVAGLEASSSSFFSDPRPQGNPELAPSHALE